MPRIRQSLRARNAERPPAVLRDPLTVDAERLADSIAFAGGVVRGGAMSPTIQRAIDLGLIVRIECDSETWRVTPGWRRGFWLVLDRPLVPMHEGTTTAYAMRHDTWKDRRLA